MKSFKQHLKEQAAWRPPPAWQPPPAWEPPVEWSSDPDVLAGRVIAADVGLLDDPDREWEDLNFVTRWLYKHGYGMPPMSRKQKAEIGQQGQSSAGDPDDVVWESFRQYITEASTWSKGWAHKSGKMLIHRGMRPYHVEQLVGNLTKFGIKKEDVMKLLEKRFDKWDAPNSKEEALKHLLYLEKGKVDTDHEIEYLAMKKGWCRVVLDTPYPSMGGKDLKIMQIVAKKLTDKYPKVFGGDMTSVELNVYSGGSAVAKRHKIRGSYDWKQWLDKGGNPDRIGAGRTEIGRTMAQFRESVRFTPTLTVKFPSANQASDFMREIGRVRGNIRVQHTHEKGYAKDIVDIKWSGSQERKVRELIGKFNGSPWHVKR